MPICRACEHTIQQAAAYCPACGAPLTLLAARIREARIAEMRSDADRAIGSASPAPPTVAPKEPYPNRP